MKDTKKRQSRYECDPKRFSRIDIQERDLEIIKEVLESRFLSTSQIQALFFGSASACKLRLQKLWNKKLLKRVFSPVSFGSSEALYCPTKRGVDLLIESGKKELEEINFKSRQNRIKTQKLQHEIGINNIKISVILAVAEMKGLYVYPGYPNSKKRPDISAIRKILSWKRGSSTWDSVKDPDKPKRIPVRPDLVLLFNGISYFLEVDRGTMTLKRFRRKLRGYRKYCSSGKFRSKYKVEDFRVLTTAPSERRRNNLLEQAIEEGGNIRVFFAVYDEVIDNPFGNIWIRGKEYKEAGILEVDRRKNRDKLVDDSVRKFGLLEEV